MISITGAISTLNLISSGSGVEEEKEELDVEKLETGASKASSGFIVGIEGVVVIFKFKVGADSCYHQKKFDWVLQFFQLLQSAEFPELPE